MSYLYSRIHTVLIPVFVSVHPNNKSKREREYTIMEWAKVEMAMGCGGSKGWGIRPRPVWFCLTSSPPHMTEKIFLPHPRILGPRKTPSPSCKTLLFVNLPITITIVFNQTGFVNKNILEITNKFILSNQFSF